MRVGVDFLACFKFNVQPESYRLVRFGGQPSDRQIPRGQPAPETLPAILRSILNHSLSPSAPVVLASLASNTAGGDLQPMATRWGDVLNKLDFVSFVRDELGITVNRATRMSPATAQCVFHDDKIPSMVLFDDRDNPHFHCFSCNAHGGLLDLVARVRGTDSDGAFAFVAQRLGLEAPTATGRKSPYARGLNNFIRLAAKHADENELRRFARERRLPISILREWNVRALDFRAVLDDAQVNAADRIAFREAGLARGFDPNRLSPIVSGIGIIFPIMQRGEAAGLLVRSVGDVVAKSARYRFNERFVRGRQLYGYDETMAALSERAGSHSALHIYVVEGVTDALRLRSLGFHALAVFGTAITRHQLDLLVAMVDEGVDLNVGVYLHIFMDGDAAGRLAVRRALALLVAEARTTRIGGSTVAAIHVDVIWSPDGQDPDDMLRDLSADAAQELLEACCFTPIAALIAIWRMERLGDRGPRDNPTEQPYGPLSPELAISELQRDTTFAQFQFRRSLDGLFRNRLDEIADSGSIFRTFIAETEAAPRREARETSDLSNFADLLRTPARYRAPDARERYAELRASEERQNDRRSIERAQTIAANSVLRREYPNDWVAWKLVVETSDYFYEILARRLSDSLDKAAPYLARYIPRESGGARLKSGPWVDEAILQQYMLNAILEVPQGGAKWPSLIPAVRKDARGRIRQTGPHHLLSHPSGIQFGEAVSFGYMISSEILEGVTPPERQGFFVPYSECWKDFIGHFYSFTYTANSSKTQFYAVRLDIRRFYDEIPRYAAEQVLASTLTDALKRGEVDPANVAPLFLPELSDPEARGTAIAAWMIDRSFGFTYQHPGTGRVTRRLNPTIGIPQGPDLSAYLANIALFPLDRSVMDLIRDLDRNLHGAAESTRQSAIYGRYVDDMVVIAASADELARIESRINSELGRIGLKAAMKENRPPPMNRRQLRAWLTSGRGIGPSGYSEESPGGSSRLPPIFDDSFGMGAPADRTEALEKMFAMSATFMSLAPNELSQRLEELLQAPGLRHYDRVRIAQMAILRTAESTPGEAPPGDTILNACWKEWTVGLRQRQPTPARFVSEPDEEFGLRAAMIVGAPLIQFVEALELAFNTRMDRARTVDADVRDRYARAREWLGRAFRDDVVAWVEGLLREPFFTEYRNHLAFMLVQQARILASLAGATPPLPDTLPDATGRHIIISWLGKNISQLKRPAAPSDVEQQSAEEFAAAVSVLAHEVAARLSHTKTPEVGEPPSDPLDVIFPAGATFSNIKELDGAPSRNVRALIHSLSPEYASRGRSIDTDTARSAFRAIVSATRAAEVLRLLSARRHLIQNVDPDFEGCSPLAMPAGLSVAALLMVSKTERPSTRMRALVLNGDRSHFSFLVDRQERLIDTIELESGGVIARASITLPNDRSWLNPDRIKRSNDVSQTNTRARASAFVEALNCLAFGGGVDLSSLGDMVPFSKYHFLTDTSHNEVPVAVGVIAATNDGPVGTKAYVSARDGDGHLSIRHVVDAIPTLWRLSIALADLYGFVDYYRLTALDRFTADRIPEPTVENNEQIIEELMRQAVPFLVGGLAHRVQSQSELYDRCRRIVTRVRRFLSAGAGEPTVSGVATLVETIAEGRFEAALSRDGAEVKARRRSWPDTVAEVARTVIQSNEFVESCLNDASLRRDRDGLLNRGADAWLAVAERYSILAMYGDPTDCTYRALVPIGCSLYAAKLALRSLGLELLACLDDENRALLQHFRFEPNGHDLGEEPVLVEAKSGLPDAAFAPDRQPNLLLRSFAWGTGAVSVGGGANDGEATGIESVSILGWIVGIAVLLGLVDLDVDKTEFDAELDTVRRPDLSAIAAGPEAEESRKDRDINAATRRFTPTFDIIVGQVLSLSDLPFQESDDERDIGKDNFREVLSRTRNIDVGVLLGAVRSLIADVRAWAGLEYKEITTQTLAPRQSQSRGLIEYNVTGQPTRQIRFWQTDYVAIVPSSPNLRDYERMPPSMEKANSGELPPFVLAETRQGKRIIWMQALSSDVSRLAFGRNAAFYPGSNPLGSLGRRIPDSPQDTPPSDQHLDDDKAEAQAQQKPDTSSAVVKLSLDTPSPESTNGDDQELSTDLKPTVAPDTRSGVQCLEELRKLQERRVWMVRGTGELGLLGTTNCRVAILQFPAALIGESHSPAFVEAEAYDEKRWKGAIQSHIETGWSDSASPIQSVCEAVRRAVISRALDACQSFGVQLLVLPEYSVRPETVNWMFEELSERRKDPNLAILAGTFRVPPGGIADIDRLDAFNKLVETEIFKRSALSSFGSILPLIYPVRRLDSEDYQDSGWALVCRSKKYPSSGLGEYISVGEDKIEPLASSKGPKDAPNYRSAGHPLDYTQELICSEAFVFMTPAAHQAMFEYVRGLTEQILGISPSIEKLQGQFVSDQTVLMTATAKQNRSTQYGASRRTIMCIPSITGRPSDHHLFAQANFAATGMVCVFASMGLKPERGGASCFIGDELKEDADGFPVSRLATPYHGIAPGIFTKKQRKWCDGALSGDEMTLVIADIDPVYTAASKPRTHDGLPPIRLVAHLPIFLLDRRSTTTPGAAKLPARYCQDIDKIEKLASSVLSLHSSHVGALSDSGRATIIGDVLDSLAKISAPHRMWLEARRDYAAKAGLLAPNRPVERLPSAFDWLVAELTDEDVVEAKIASRGIAGFDPCLVGPLTLDESTD